MASFGTSRDKPNYRWVFILLVMAILIALLLIGVRSMGSESQPPLSDSEEKTSSENNNEVPSVIQFFETPANSGQSKPASLEPKKVGDTKKECVLDGITMQEGVVSSETVCVNP